jgi:preprotein translocase subunit SecE
VAKSASVDNLRDASAGGNWFTRARRFLAEVRGELSRVTWPTRREVWATTIVVILVSTFFGLYLWAIDLALSYIQFQIFSWFGAS